ncbi:transcription factor mef2A [Wyeomyia smithii]|uniref:transcription factor mef2A n=1 Tax=Wyeomyia smithii TaxID=174621 RepID=UPI002467B5AB|nr:transcription factor mef2A [Wyeomyia smithii]XP_055533136.1 transcription factor mef2A [Wyeomyia smithii]XP_055533137.1 transcription factor mef2A [Wyeomyia smithii]XP_055533138.1 transcription factor mef2A [Wyeomyia smithii]XP_055533139.1 transcription factor mef2A [Wyeomyia smithii]XP_055533140.1 transcription factor mef2A [Wyeomyia smithii]XP_055533141.1 transcription factor mef2A [Wyeomyia smithii]XP_055533142.1 transcription factor mef2A [Wyeomyia smithii]XP_055533143.1 transcriptio
MSMKRLAVIAAVSTHNSLSNQTVSYYNAYANHSTTTYSSARGVGSSSHSLQGLQGMRPGANLHGNVNIMLGGAMLSVVITVVCFVCYCCHRNIKKRSNSIYRQQWLENEANMEIYSVEQCYDQPAGISDATGGGSFFVDTNTGNEYQSLPVSTYQHHSQHPGGSPPSYDTVLAQDEMAASARRKSCDFGLLAPLDGNQHTRGAGKFDALLCELIGANQRRKRNRPTADRAEFNDFSEILRSPGCGETEISGNCHCQLNDNLQVFCRNCGQFVNGEMMQSPSNDNHYYDNSSNGYGANDGANWHRQVAIHGGDNSLDGTGNMADNNGNIQTAHALLRDPNLHPDRHFVVDELLQDLHFHSHHATNHGSSTRTGCATNQLNSTDCTNNNNENMSNNNNNNNIAPDCATGFRECNDTENDEQNNNINNDNASAESSTFETIMNNGSLPADNNTYADGCSGNHANRLADVITSTIEVGSAVNVTTAAVGAADDDKSSDNGSSDTTDGPSEQQHQELDDNFHNLSENGLVRLDMSQIIDRTGLPTYEAALRLESSGYV